MGSNYFYGEEPEQYSFYRIPKKLFTDVNYETLPAEAKLLYGIVLDRLSLSIANGWKDERGRTFIYLTIDFVQKELGYAKQKVCKLLKLLEEAGLIERVRQGQGKPNIIYVKRFGYVANKLSTSSMKFKLENSEGNNSKGVNLEHQEVLISNGNNTNINNTNKSNTNLSINQDEIDGYYEYFRNQFEIDKLISEYPTDKEIIEALFDLVVETCNTNKTKIKIGGEYKSTEVVKSQLMKLDQTHILYVLECLEKNCEPVRNIKQYMLMCLYNAPFTIQTYYQTKVNSDMKKRVEVS